MTKTLQELIDESIFISTEYQARLAELTQGAGWDVDFSAPAFTLQTEPPVTLTPYLLGTESASRGSWIWSWQELGHFPAAVVSAAVQAREAGERLGVDELSTDELPVAEGLARRLTLAAKAVTGVYAHYPAGAGGGVTAWLLLDGPEFELPELTVERMMRVIAEALTTDTAVDHNLAVDSYAKLRGAHIEWDTEATCVVTVRDGAQRFWFDDHQISGVEPAEPSVGPEILVDLAADAQERAATLREDRAAAEATAARQEAEPHRAAAPAAPAETPVPEEAPREQPEPIEVPDFVETEHVRPEPAEEPRPAEEPAAAHAGAAEADLPFDQEPSDREVRPGRVSTTVVPGPEPVRPAREEVPEPAAAQHREPAAEPQVEREVEREVVAGPGVPGSAGTEPVVEGEETAEEEQGERKKGFFSRFFGL
ncbi:hypothetical protein CIK52_03035 [Kocuria rosea]|uniref:Hydrolase n=1 Tax=Kocuria rosea subsp. polaris TaxID=136273 RepID=A0A0A6VU41_KOCRO|nr:MULTISPECIES: DUF6882 domain-containing protein [Kocuria]EYT53528.1 hydrolase [Kocuria sp. UCD-OTCP]KHD98126.1 hypothetical protein GY22_06160 [Kocuria polaris]PWF88268.1 hypothetical protein CIK52_03035 [Kocuria rosea]QCY32380.1 hypothetical protein EQG70_05425 [Kocuria rosea]TQN34404.1 hypothetical protein FHX38_2927 [Kocuria rosea]